MKGDRSGIWEPRHLLPLRSKQPLPPLFKRPFSLRHQLLCPAPAVSPLPPKRTGRVPPCSRSIRSFLLVQRSPSGPVQLPIYNERYVIRRLLEAVCALDYPRDRLEIQLLDDSTDDTAEIAHALTARYRQQGLTIIHVRRNNRHGFKAGALKEGMRTARGEFLAIFDADFVPPADFLRKTIPYFRNPKVGMVQARWGHTNPDYSLLTRTQSIGIDAHFSIEQGARSWSGLFLNFNGTAGIWRRQAIIGAGGWQADTLTEDMDLSYRAQLAGWQLKYVLEVACPAELPVQV